MQFVLEKIASELSVGIKQVEKTVELLDSGDTVPFISRYRKEVTGGLSDTQLRTLEERLTYWRELVDRRDVIIDSIERQGKLTESLKEALLAADTKARLEDLYKPYKPKRRTRGQIAIEAGLQPLADALFQDPNLVPEEQAVAYVNAEKGIADIKTVLEGARYILMEQFADEANLVGQLRQVLYTEGFIVSKVLAEQEQTGNKFKDYFDFREAIKSIPSHRALAILRGRNDGVLHLSIDVDHPCDVLVAQFFNLEDKGRPADKWLLDVAKWTWQVKLKVQLEVELISQMRERAEEQAIQVFGTNLKDLLMAAPAGQKRTLGLDPGFRTGVKLAVVDETGKLLDHGTIFPHAPQNQWDDSLHTLFQCCQQHTIELISIGNGTASRETEKLVQELLKQHKDLNCKEVMVSEAGASVYSASEFAAKEFPELDVSFRGAVSIARRLQDPLAELVKIEPKSVGVGQYQHDVSQNKLIKVLDNVVEDCVNTVGVDLNTASVPLLSKVSGLNKALAANIVAYRDQYGVFRNRETLKSVPRLGEKAFEQAAGFLKITQGDNPLDASSVHPESYPLVERILMKTQKTLSDILGKKELLKQIRAEDYMDDQFGLPTVQDILQELEKPGRDPRPEFKTAQFKAGIEKITDLKPGMLLEGVVTNVADFGAFVDVGVHQDGLVHISAMSNQFIKNPRDVVKTGDIVQVKVLEVQPERKRISLTMRLNDDIQQEKKDALSSKPSQKSDPAKNSFRSEHNMRRKKEKKAQSNFGSQLLKAISKKQEECV